MRRFTCYCDICGQEMTSRDNSEMKINGCTYRLERTDYYHICSPVDLCKKCKKNLIKFLKSNIENEELLSE